MSFGLEAGSTVASIGLLPKPEEPFVELSMSSFSSTRRLSIPDPADVVGEVLVVVGKCFE